MANNGKGKTIYIGTKDDEEKQETVDTGLPNFYELEQSISHLEVVFKHLKDKKGKKEKK
jgi:hypothetical protein